MVRTCTILLLAAVGSAWASAQGPTTGDRRGLLQKNQGLLARLVEDTVAVAAADTPLAKAEVCQRTAAELARELQRAADADDADRVAEVGEYLAASVEHGLTPALTQARAVIPTGSDEALKALHAKVTTEAEQAEASIPHVGRVGQSRLVKDARQKLAAARALLADAVR